MAEKNTPKSTLGIRIHEVANDYGVSSYAYFCLLEGLFVRTRPATWTLVVLGPA